MYFFLVFPLVRTKYVLKYMYLVHVLQLVLKYGTKKAY